jgi:hypothetical protein
VNIITECPIRDTASFSTDYEDAAGDAQPNCTAPLFSLMAFCELQIIIILGHVGIQALLPILGDFRKDVVFVFF